MKTKITFFVVLMTLFNIFCRGSAEEAELPRRLDQDLCLTKEEGSVLETRAEAGDNEAAAKLARYYDFYVHDYNSAKYWFEKAARNGHVQSQYNLGVRLYLKKRDAESCKEAQYWFRMALANGLFEAQEALDYLGECPRLKAPNSEVGAAATDAGANSNRKAGEATCR